MMHDPCSIATIASIGTGGVANLCTRGYADRKRGHIIVKIRRELTDKIPDERIDSKIAVSLVTLIDCRLLKI